MADQGESDVAETTPPGGRRALVLAVGVALAVGALFVWDRSDKQQSHVRAAEVEIWRFRKCLYGPPLEADELASQRLVAMDLCGARADRGEGTRCERHLHAFLKELDQLEVGNDDPRFGEARKMARVAVEVDIEKRWLAGEPPLIDQLEAAFGKSGIPIDSSAQQPTVCREKALFAGPQLASLGRTESAFPRQPRSLGKTLRVAWSAGEDSASLACWFSADGAAVARCGAPRVSNLATPLEADDAFKGVILRDFREEEPRYRIVDETGATLMEHSFIREHGLVLANRELSVQDFNGNLWSTRDGTPVQLDYPALRGVTPNAVRPGWILWQEPVKSAGKDSGRVVVHGMRANDQGEPVGEGVVLGEMPEPALLRTCADGPGGVAFAFLHRGKELVHDGDETFQRHGVSIAFPAPGGGFRPLQEANIELPWDGGSLGGDVDRGAQFGCSPKGSPRWAWRRGGAIRDLTCGPEGCRERSTGVIAPEIENVTNFAFAPVGDDSLLVAYEGSTRRGFSLLLHTVRARVGSISEIATLSDRVVVADENHGGLPQLWWGLFAFGRGNIGWLALRSGADLYAFRVTSDAAFTPVRLE